MINCTLIAAFGMVTSVHSLDLSTDDLARAEFIAAIELGRIHADMAIGRPALAARQRSGSILCQGGAWLAWGPDATGIVAAGSSDGEGPTHP
ncbi:MAG: hypothetical protein RLO50_10290 [Azospirillaceae bacterium]